MLHHPLHRSSGEILRWLACTKATTLALNASSSRFVKMEEAIVTNSPLLVGDTVPIAFRDLIATPKRTKP